MEVMAPLFVLAMRSSSGGQLRAHRGLVAQARGHLAHESGDFRAGLDEAEDVVDQQQHVPVLVVPKVFGHRERRVGDPKRVTGRLVHLAEDHHHVRDSTPASFMFAIQLLAFAAALADAAEDADTVVMSDHVVNHFGEQDCLADAGTAEQARFAAALQGHEHIDGLDAGLEDLALARPLRQARWRPVYRAQFDICEFPATVDRSAEHVEHPRAYRLTDRDLERTAGVFNARTARQSLRGSHGNSADTMRIQLGPNLDQDLRLVTGAKQVVYRRQVAIEVRVNDAAAN
jgi:hypothetical protein